MKALTIPLSFSTVVLLAACSSQPPQLLAEQQPVEMPTHTIPAQDFVLRGQIYVDNNQYHIQPCGSDHRFWLELPSKALEQVNQLSLERGSQMYGEVLGHLNTTPAEGPSSPFLARFVTNTINVLSPKEDTCQPVQNHLLALGSDPSWQVKIENGQVQYEDWNNRQVTTRIKSSNISAKQQTYHFADQSQLVITPQYCFDEKSKNLYAWSATFTTNNQTQQGCLQQANIDINQQWASVYQSKTIAGLTTSLILNADHTATTRYDYQNGDDSVTEQGFWQQVNDKQINVVMSRYQGRKLTAQRIYDVNGFTLLATQETINGMEYNLGDRGLSLERMQSDITMAPTTTKASQGNVSALPNANIAGRHDYNAKVDATIRHYFAMNRSKPDNNRYRWLTYDINNDQKPELFVLTDWCGSGGCTMLMFENHNNEWRFNSRITQVHTPIQVTNYHHFGWRDLIIPVSGGGANAAIHAMEYTGVSYPLNASTAPESDKKGNVTLFSDNISAAQQGIKM